MGEVKLQEQMTPTLEHTRHLLCTKTGKAAPCWSTACLPFQGEERSGELKFLLGTDTIVSALELPCP